MSQITVSQIEKSILQLPVAEQLLIISRVAEKLRRELNDESTFDAQLAEMANNPDIKREISEINADFKQTEFDGLEKY